MTAIKPDESVQQLQRQLFRLSHESHADIQPESHDPPPPLTSVLESSPESSLEPVVIQENPSEDRISVNERDDDDRLVTACSWQMLESLLTEDKFFKKALEVYSSHHGIDKIRHMIQQTTGLRFSGSGDTQDLPATPAHSIPSDDRHLCPSNNEVIPSKEEEEEIPPEPKDDTVVESAPVTEHPDTVSGHPQHREPDSAKSESSLSDNSVIVSNSSCFKTAYSDRNLIVT